VSWFELLLDVLKYSIVASVALTLAILVLILWKLLSAVQNALLVLAQISSRLRLRKRN